MQARFDRAGAGAILGMLAVAGCNSLPLLPPGALPTPDPAAAKRGEYLVTAAGCAGCHTDKDHGGKLFAGGKAIETPFGNYISRNITPDPETGIGRWSDAGFVRALREGLSPAGVHYFAVFPFTSFTFMTDRDILDVRAYLASVPAVQQENRGHDVSFPFDVRLTMVPWRWLYFEEGPYVPDPHRSAEWNRGAYLATAVVHCRECHTPRGALGGLAESRAFTGGKISEKGPNPPNITPDPKDGIGAWSADDIAQVLAFGLRPNGDPVAGAMADVVEDTSHLTPEDRGAIALYIKSLKPLPGRGNAE